MTAEWEILLRQAQAGDIPAREQLIRQFTPLAVRVAARQCGRYLHLGVDDELSIALIALDEAVDQYQEGKGGFIRFAETVVQRRLIDYFRREGKRSEIPLSELEITDEEGGVYNPAEERAALDEYARDQEAELRREEIVRYSRDLERYGLSFGELTRIAPRHADARLRAFAVAQRLISDPSLFEPVRKTGMLPLKQLEADPELGLSRKTLERQRRYILAITLLLHGDYPELQSYLKGWIEKEEQPCGA